MKLLPLFRPCLAIALILQAHGALAQTVSDEDELAAIYGDKRTVTIATGSAQTLRRAPAVATVVTAKEIAAMGASDLDQVLETVANLHVERSANQYAPLYVVRGIVSQFTPQLLVLQNGIPMTTLYHGNKGNVWGGYPIDHIARIEIIRGPGSALYGADAFSGVINIITKTAADTAGTELGGRIGSFASRDGWVQYGGKLGEVDVAAFLRAGHTDGFKRLIEKDAMTRNDTLFGTHASLAPGDTNTGNDAFDGNLDLSWRKWRARAGYKLRDKVGTGAGIASALDPVGYSRGERLTADLSWTDPEISNDWGAGVMLSHMQFSQETPVDYQLLPPGLRLPTGLFPNGMIGGPDFWERQWRLSAYATYTGMADHHWRFGLGHDDLDLYRTKETRNFNYTAGGTPIPLPSVVDFSNTNPFLFPHRRKNDYVYLQDEWKLVRDWTLTAGVRHDRYSDFGGTTNPRAALVWDASLDLTVKLLYGRAFRAPAFVEAYGITNPVVVGNPNLKPEVNNTLESVFAWQPRADTQLNLTLFRYAMSGIIRTVVNSTPGTGATYANTGDQKGHGAELEGIWNINRDVRINANYAYQHSTDETTHLDAGYAPHHHLNSRIDWQSGPWQASAQVNFVGARMRAAGDARPAMSDNTTVDFTLASHHSKQWSVSASIRNAFNADVREPSVAPGLALPKDLPVAPRALWLQVVLKL